MFEFHNLPPPCGRLLVATSLFLEIEHQEIVQCRRATRAMPRLARKLQMIRRTWYSQHDAIESNVVLEHAEFAEAKSSR